MLKSRLFVKILAAMLAVIGVLSAAIWLFTVPMIERKAYEIELGASRTILDNVHAMAAEMAGGLAERRAITLRFFQDQVREAVTIAAALIEDVFARRDRGEISDADARRIAFESLRSLKYGRDDYVWVADYAANILSHPDPRHHGHNAAGIVDPSGDAIIPKIVEIARADGEGTWTYDWARLGAGKPARKIAYFKDLPKLGLVVGSGTYLDDIEEEVEKRRTEAIGDLRKALAKLQISRTGYAFVFDGSSRMVIHPDPKLEGTEFSALPDAATGRPIAEELRAVSDTGRPLYYLWDKPGDPGHYVYDKISWVRHFAEFDWYIASSVYVDELTSSSAELGQRILIVAGTIMALAALIGGLGVWRIVQPLQKLAATAVRVSGGDLEARADIRRSDEIGVLATAFDAMVGRLRENVALLGERVAARTAELETTNRRLRDAVVAEQRSQAALAEAEARQRLILDAMPAAIAHLDGEGRFRFVNRGWAEMVGRDKAAIIGRPLGAVIGRVAHRAIREPMERSRSGEIVHFDYAWDDRDGRRQVRANTLIPKMGDDGRPTGWFVLGRDVTDEKETERRIFEAEHLKAIGQLSGGLAHDFNNLLSIIIGNLATARERYAEVPGLVAYIEPAERASRRGADLTSRLLAFARQQPLRTEIVDVGDLLADVVTLIRRTLPPTIDIVLVPPEAPCRFLGDHAQLERAVINLALNARDALPDGGRVTLACRALVVDGPLAFDEPVPEGEWIEITVADTGTGFPEGVLSRAFEPFFTTKQLGSGLGLAMVWGFVKQSNGFIRIDSEEGRGATVRLLLARADEVAAALSAVPMPLDAGGGDGPVFAGELALVAEDDDDVRRVVTEQMIGLGFSVIEAEDGEEAWRLIEAIAGIRVVVSDIVMTGFSGRELARRIRAGHPAIAVMLMTGFSLEDGGEEPDGVPIVRKPWDKRDLVAALTAAKTAASPIETERPR